MKYTLVHKSFLSGKSAPEGLTFFKTYEEAAVALVAAKMTATFPGYPFGFSFEPEIINGWVIAEYENGQVHEVRDRA